MKQKIHYLFMLLLMLLTGVGGVKAETTYKLEKVTEVEAGGLYVFVQSGYVMTTVSNKVLQITKTYKTTGLEGSENYVFTLESATASDKETPGFKMKNMSLSSKQYIGNSSNKTDMTATESSDAAVWAFTFQDDQDDQTVLIQNLNNSNRFLGLNQALNNNPTGYKAYATNNMSANPHAIFVYKLVEESSLPSAGLAFAENSYNVTYGESFTAPTLTNPNNLQVTYASSNTDVATVDPTTGAVTLVGAGTTTITASFAGNDTYAADEASYELTVKKAPVVYEGNYFVKVTSADKLTDGAYLIVYENEKGNVAFNGGLETLDATSNTISVTIDGNGIEATNAAKAALFVWDGEVETLQSISGYYIGKTAYSNGLDSKTEPVYTNTISFDDYGNAVITASGNCILRYNNASDQNRFRYFKSGQEPIALYKLTTLTPKVSPELSFGETTEFNINLGDEFTAPTLATAEGFDGTVTYSSDNQKVATVNAAGEVEIKGVGTAVITAASDETDNFTSGTASYTIKVVKVYSAIADFKALEVGTVGLLNLTGAQIVYVDKEKKTIYVRDNSGAIALYNNDGFETELKAGDILEGTIEGKYSQYKNLPEITNISNIGELTATGTEDVVSVVISPEEIADYLCQLVTFAKTDISNNNNKYYADGNVQLYDSFYKFGELEEGVYKVSGVALVYNDQYEIAPRTADDISKIPVVAAIGTKKYETLEAAFAAVQDDETITLLDDVTLADKLVVALGGKAVTLDLGEKTLTGRTNLTSGNLTVTNGTIVGGSQQALNVYGSATNAENYSVLTIADNVTVTADVYGVSMFGATAGGDGYGAVVNIAGKVTTTGDNKNGAVFVSGNLGHGIANDMNNVINVTGSITSATDAAIALNGNATVNVKSGAEITGNTGIAVKRGVLNVEEDATVHATGEANLTPGANNNGTEMTGAAISMTDTYNNYGAMAVNITGGTFTSDNTDALFKEDGTYTNAATYSVSGGTFNSAVPAEFCAPGYEPKDLGNGQYSVYAPTYEVAIKSVTPKADSWYISGTPYIQFTITKDGEVLSTKQLNQEQLDKWDIILDENYLTLKSKAAFAKWLQYTFNVVGAGTTTIVFQNKANPEIKVEQEVSISHKLILTILPAGTHMVEAGPVEIATNTKFDGVAIENFEDYTFTSSDESIATISGTTITPLKAGTITVTATKNDDQTASASANVTFIDAPAKIGDVYYESIGKAMEAAQSGETITLLRDVTESYPFTGNQPRTNDFALTIDLNGHTWNGTSDKPYVLRVDYGTITIKDSQSGGGVKYGSDYAFIVSHLASEYPSKLILENGTFTGKTSVAQVGNPGGSGSNKKYYGGDLVVNGGTFVTVPDEGETYDENGNFKYTLNKLDMVESSYPGGIYSPSTITVNGGKFLKFDPQNNLAEGANTNFVPEGLVSTKSVESGEAWYTISKIVAKIDETTYASLADAFTAATNGQTITVLTDIDLPSTIAVTKQVTLDLNGKTISNTSDLWVGGNWSFFSVQANGNLTVTGDGTIDAKENDCYTFDVRDGGILTIKNGTFTGNISSVYLINEAGTGVSTCNIEGGTFSIKQLADEQGDRYRFLLNCYDASYKNNTVKFNVTGGSFVNFNPANNQAEGAETNFCAAGYEAVQDGDVWTVQKAPVAQIGETTYTSLADAFTAATNGQTITVLTDIDLPSTIAVTKQVTLDLNGKTISNTSALWVGKNWSFFSVQANGNLTVTGDGTIDAKENDCYTFDVRDGGVLTIKDGTFTGNISCVYLYNKENIGVSTCNIEGGTFSIKQLADEQGDRYRFLLNCYDASYKNNTVKFNVTGGSFVNFNPANNQAEGAATNFCAAGYEAVQDGNVWTVQQIQLSAPIIFHDSGEYEGELQIAMAGEGTIMYTLNDGEAQTYSAPFTIRDEGEYIIKAWAVKDGVASDVTEPKTFTIKKKAKSAVVEDGYYTIQTNDDKYVNVAGRKTVTLVNDTKSAGTVIRVKADEEGVKVLRSQAVDLPRYAERAMSYVPEIVKEVVKKLAANVDDPIIGEQGADLILDKFKKEFDYHLYLEGENNTYRIYGRTPSMKPVVDFYAENKELVDSRLPKLEKFVKEVLQEIVNKVGRGQSVVDMFKVKTIWQNMGGKLTDPDVDQAKFFEEVLSSEKNTWEFAYQTGMLYWEKVKGYLTDNISELGDYGKYIEKIPQIRPNFRYYIVPGENGVDIISEGNSQITDASTAWTLTKREGFDVTFDATLSKNNGKEMYKTLYVDFGYKLPDGVTALKVTAIDENTGVAKTEEIGQEVAPQTPVLLKSDKAGDITLTIGDNFGSAVTDNQLVGADYLINKYEINTPQVESIFTLLANLSKSLANEYSYLKRKNAGTVNNKYFFGLTKDDLKLCFYLNDNEEKDCVVRSLSMGDEKLGFYNNWTAKANEAFLVSEQFNPVKLTLKGDVNRDGSITIADVTALVNIILGKATYPADADKYDFEAAHVNADEEITIADVTALVNIILGKTQN